MNCRNRILPDLRRAHRTRGRVSRAMPCSNRAIRILGARHDEPQQKM
jgi:hypothetical protein